jgi:hypothetical protein
LPVVSTQQRNIVYNLIDIFLEQCNLGITCIAGMCVKTSFVRQPACAAERCGRRVQLSMMKEARGGGVAERVTNSARLQPSAERISP